MKIYCSRCGNVLNKDDKFCSECGYENPNLIKETTSNTTDSTTNAINNEVEPTLSESKKIKSFLIMSIVAIFLNIISPFMGIIFSIISLINGLKIRKGIKGRTAIIVISIIGLVAPLIVLLVVAIFFSFNLKSIISNIDTNNPTVSPVAGRYNCQTGSSTFDYGRYDLVLYMDGNENFTLGLYGNLPQNRVLGKYTYELSDTSNTDSKYKTYTIEFTSDKDSYITDGVIQDETFNKKATFSIKEVNNKREGLLIFNSDFTYYCFAE